MSGRRIMTAEEIRRATTRISHELVEKQAGTTAMRLPRGTIIRICGDGGCILRTVTDYGPSAAIRPVRIIDLDRADFFAICGCPSWSGTTTVTVSVY